MRPSVLRALLCALMILCVAAPAASGRVGPDYVSSDNIELVNRIKTVGDGVGGRIVGNYLYVTSTKSLSIFDIATDPENPTLVGQMQIDVEWENEEVPTNGKLLGMSAEIGCKDPLGVLEGSPRPPTTGSWHCINLYDVSDKNNVRFIKSVDGAGNHTSACVLDCSYMWGDNGPITDTRDPKNAKIVGNWLQASKANTSCHAVREIADGIVFGACQPIVVLSVRPEHGGSPLKPVVIARASNEDDRFIHSNRWPRQGKDRFALVGGEQNATGTCDDQVSAFMVWDATPALNPDGSFKMGGTMRMLDEVRPRNGTYADGNSPYNVLGCSVHWFTEHPEFRNGGAVALAEYENGTRLLQVTPAGKIVEQGYFLPMGGSTSAPHFHPNGKVIYAIDYTRGVDVLRYTGPSYRAGPDPFNPGDVEIEPGTTPGTNGAVDERAIAELRARERQRAQACTPTARAASARGTRRTLKLGVPAGTRYDATIFQVSKGRTVLRAKRVKAFNGKTGEITWKASRKLRDGYYVIRFTTRDGRREIAVRLVNGRFRSAPNFSEAGCGVIKSFSLDGPVFGGRTKRALGVNFTLNENADRVLVEVIKGRKVRRRVTRRNVVAGKAVRLKLRGRGVTRGTQQVRLTALRGGQRLATTTLGARGI
jgi:hypothetical protein